MTQQTYPNPTRPRREPVACRRERRGLSTAAWFGRTQAGLLSVLLLSGCARFENLHDETCYNHDLYELTTGIQTAHRAHQAWKHRAVLFSEEPHKKDFAAGFRQGYCDVASGEEGCPPPLPPRKYWASCYETPEGQRRIAAWFAGYPHGVRAAEEEAAGAFRPVHAPAELRYQQELQCAQALAAEEENLELTPAEDAQRETSPESRPPPPSPDKPHPPPVGTTPVEHSAAAEGGGPTAAAGTAETPVAPVPVQTWTPAQFDRR